MSSDLYNVTCYFLAMSGRPTRYTHIVTTVDPVVALMSARTILDHPQSFKLASIQIELGGLEKTADPYGLGGGSLRYFAKRKFGAVGARIDNFEEAFLCGFVNYPRLIPVARGACVAKPERHLVTVHLATGLHRLVSDLSPDELPAALEVLKNLNRVCVFDDKGRMRTVDECLKKTVAA